jgi:hypothetical protein
MHFSDVEVGKQLIVGNGTYYDTLGLGENVIRGSAYIEGPFLVGDAKSFGEVVATTMIARDVNEESNNPPRSLHVRGDIKTEGDGENAAHVLISGTANADALVVEGNQTINSGNLHDSHLVNNTFTGLVGSGGAFTGSTINVQGWKGFDIVHPSKKGHRLRHICLEGPEGGVYIRGKVKNDKVILLPDYWKELVDINSITVQLQPIGAHQDIIVKRWDAEKVELQSKPGIPIHCFYHIFAERIDGEQLVVEYKGETPDEYPGDNSQYSIAGYHYDTRN